MGLLQLAFRLLTSACVCYNMCRHERAADGSADISRPLYSISNPNDAVDRILRTYEENVMGSLHTILEQVSAILVVA